MGGRDPQTHELWSFYEDGITREDHPFAWIDVGDFRGYCFHTAYATEIGRRVFISSRKSINGSFEWLGVPAPSCGTGVAWTENILVPNLCWGDRCGYKRWALSTHYRPRFRGRSFIWSGAVPFRPDYVPSSLENSRTRARRVRDVHLRETYLAWAQTLARALKTRGNKRGNR